MDQGEDVVGRRRKPYTRSVPSSPLPCTTFGVKIPSLQPSYEKGQLVNTASLFGSIYNIEAYLIGQTNDSVIAFFRFDRSCVLESVKTLCQAAFLHSNGEYSPLRTKKSRKHWLNLLLREDSNAIDTLNENDRSLLSFQAELPLFLSKNEGLSINEVPLSDSFFVKYPESFSYVMACLQKNENSKMLKQRSMDSVKEYCAEEEANENYA